MRAPVLIIAAAITLHACQLVYRVRVQNTSDSPITIQYKIQPMGYEGVFFEEAQTFHGSSADSTITMDRADSTITFTLLPGQHGTLGDCRPCQRATTVEAINASGSTRRINLYWMRITQHGRTTTYTPDELLRTAERESTILTLLSAAIP